MLHNRGGLSVVSFTRLDQVALELPPNDVEQFSIPANPIAALGGATQPRGGGGMIPPQNGKYNPATHEIDPVVVVKSIAPPDRQRDYTNDGGSITATPPPSVTRQENQKGIVSASADWKDADVFGK